MLVSEWHVETQDGARVLESPYLNLNLRTNAWILQKVVFIFYDLVVGLDSCILCQIQEMCEIMNGVKKIKQRTYSVRS